MHVASYGASEVLTVPAIAHAGFKTADSRSDMVANVSSSTLPCIKGFLTFSALVEMSQELRCGGRMCGLGLALAGVCIWTIFP